MKSKLDDWRGFCDPPEFIQRCLSCPKARCDNCLQWELRENIEARDEENAELAKSLRKRFIQAIESCGSIIGAARKIGVTRYFVYKWYGVDWAKKALQKALEWRIIRKMLDSGMTKSRIARTLHISSAWYIMGRHAERYEQYIHSKRRRGEEPCKKKH